MRHRSNEFSRELLLETGATIGLFLGLEFYLDNLVHEMRKHEVDQAKDLATDIILDKELPASPAIHEPLEFGPGDYEPEEVTFSESDDGHIERARNIRVPRMNVSSAKQLLEEYPQFSATVVLNTGMKTPMPPSAPLIVLIDFSPRPARLIQ